MTQIAELQYEYDKVGNPIKITREDGAATYYEYDRAKQLTAETQVDDQTQVEYDFAYEYSGAHNRTVKVDSGTPSYYTYNAANQMLTETTGAETTYYHYDGCGNTTAKQEPAGTTYYQYNTENLMTRIDFPDDTHSYYTYDADSKRVSQRTADGYSEFIYQGPDMLKLQMERDENGDTKVQYTMGNGLEAMRRDAGSGMSSGDSSFYHYNHLGTTVALTNAAASVSDTYRHDAWGVRLASTGSTVNPHAYVGRERYYRMPDAGLYHLGFRDYAQTVGRFTTVDPVYDDGLPYLYVGARPSVSIDPSGAVAAILPGVILAGEAIAAAIEAAAIAAAILAAIASAVEAVRRCLCVNRLGWPPCNGIGDPRVAAANPFQSDFTSKPNIPDPSEWQAIGRVRCKRVGGTVKDYFGRPQLYFYCNVKYQNILRPGLTREVMQTVVCEGCCLVFSTGEHCRRVHHSG